eukprot:1695428-Rhodomonas_salina.4
MYHSTTRYLSAGHRTPYAGSDRISHSLRYLSTGYRTAYAISVPDIAQPTLDGLVLGDSEVQGHDRRRKTLYRTTRQTYPWYKDCHLQYRTSRVQTYPWYSTTFGTRIPTLSTVKCSYEHALQYQTSHSSCVGRYDCQRHDIRSVSTGHRVASV